MLHNENEIETDREKRETELDRVADKGRQVAGNGRVQALLNETKGAASEVEQNVGNAPTDGGLAPIVEHCLRNVFGGGDNELDVGAHAGKVEPRGGADARERGGNVDGEPERGGQSDGGEGRDLAAGLVDEALRNGEARDEESEDGEGDVGHVDGNDAVRVALGDKVLVLHRAVEIKQQVVCGVSAVAGEVEQLKVKGEADDRFATPVQIALWNEGNGPCEEINDAANERER